MFNFLRNYGVEKILRAKKLIRSFREFEKEFPKEEDSVEHFARLVIDGFGVFCKICSSSQIKRAYGSRVFRCLDCRSKGWIFSGTFFQKMRVAKLWNATIWLYERRIQFNAWQLSELCQVAYSSALVINRKIAKIIFSLSCENAEIVPSEVFMILFRKRSRETPANLHPKFEQLDLEEANSGLKSFSNSEAADSDSVNSSDDPNLSDVENRVLKLMNQTPIHFDQLCQKLLLPAVTMGAALVELELNGRILRHGGDYFTLEFQPKASSPAFMKRQELIKQLLDSAKVEKFIKFAMRNFHGFSRKYLQFYLAKYTAIVLDDFMHPGKILRECLNQNSFSYVQMLEYVSPCDVSL